MAAVARPGPFPVKFYDHAREALRIMRGKKRLWAATAALPLAAALGTPAVNHAQAALAAPSASPVRHVVVLFLENHSFDSVLGFWCRNHPRRCPNGGMPSSVTLSDGAVVTPFRDPDTVPNIRHTVPDQVAAINGGRMDGWANMPNGNCTAATGYRCISGYQPDQVPNLTALAQSFAISDHTFSVADSPSWAGHMAIAAASTDHFVGNNPHPVPGVPAGPGWGCDSKRVTEWVASSGKLKTVPSCVPDPSLPRPFGGAFEQTPVNYVPTIMDRIHAAGRTWKIYGSPKGARGYGFWDICPTFAECLDTGQSKHLVPDSRFMTDAAQGTLPNFSVVTPGGQHFLDGCHNNMSMTACDNWIGQLVGAVEKSPEWSSTAVFLTFDDFGGFYDQVPPPREPDGTQEGPRVPLIIISPYAKRGYTDTTSTTFAGILAYTEKNFGLHALGVNDAGAYDSSKAFNYSQAPVKGVRMVTRPLPPSARHIQLTPSLEHDPT
jgi:phospholipase C